MEKVIKETKHKDIYNIDLFDNIIIKMFTKNYLLKKN